MRTLHFPLSAMFMIGIILQSCHHDTSDTSTDYSILSLDDFKEVTIENEHQWEDAPDDQLIGAVYSQQKQYAVFMPMDSCQMHFYDLDMKPLYNRVVAGQGPGEFVTPEYCGQWREAENGEILTAIFDSSTDCIMDVSSEFNGGKEIAMMPQKYGLSPVFMISNPADNCLYGVSSYLSCKLGRGVMFKYDTSTDSLKYSLPTFEVGNSKAAFTLMQKGFAASHDCRLFVNAYLYEPVIEFWDDNMDLLSSYRLKDVDIVDYDFNRDTSTSFFRGVQVADKYIYILYYGRSYGAPGDSYLLAFDRSFAPAFKINIGQAYWFTVNESTGTIIMMRYNDDGEPTAYFASMPLL